MNSVLTIIKKEFARFFKDIRLVVTALILPGLLIFAVYSLMGSIMESVENKDAQETCTAYVVNMPESRYEGFSSLFELTDNYTPETANEALKDGSLDLMVIFPGDDSQSKINIYFNSVESKSQTAYAIAMNLVANYEIFDIADAQSTSQMVLSMVVPMVLLMLLFSGCMSVAPESIAGEKERGTIATLLVTPVKRSSIAIGKIAALSVIALLSGLSSTVGMALSLPKLAGSAGGITLSIFTFGDIMALLAIILSTVLVLVTLISIISAFAKSVKEASGLVVPLMIIVMLCGIFSMFVEGVSPIGIAFVPVLNSAVCISSIISGAFNAAAFAITVCVNVAVTALLVLALALMFNSERIMFNK